MEQWKEDKQPKEEREQKFKEDFKKGTKFGHSVTKPLPEQAVVEVPDPVTGAGTTAIDKVIQHYAQEWSQWWDAKEKEQQSDQGLWPEDTEVPDMDPEDIRAAGAGFENVTVCPCGLHPRHFAILSGGLLKVIARQLSFGEKYGRVARQERLLY